jgi:hypothetical protein
MSKKPRLLIDELVITRVDITVIMTRESFLIGGL